MNDRDYMSRVLAMERRLYRIAQAILWNDSDAADAIQSAVFKAWAKKGGLREERYFETWLIRILINECKNIWRRKPRIEMELPDNLNIPVNGEQGMFEILMALPEKQRITLELHYIEGYRTREIALLLGVPESTVKWRLAQGRRTLKRMLGEEAGL